MKILVTGATGLVGRLLCKELLLKNHQLVVVGRSPEQKFRQTFSLPCEYQTWEKINPEGVEAIIHLAGDPIASERWSSQKKASILKSRTQTTQQLANAFKAQWPSVFIGASAIGYYGDRGNEILDENSQAGQGFLSEVCQKWEDSYHPFEKHSRLVKMRIGIVLDCRGGFLEPMEKLFSFGLGGRVANGKQWMSWIHSNDLVRSFLFALENPIEGIFNAVAPQPTTNSEWTKTYSQQLKVMASFPAPALALKTALGEMSQLALNSQRVSSKKLISNGFQFQFEKLDQALKDLYLWKTRPSERLFTSEQWIPAKKEDVFPFFSEAKNLEKITPPWLKFKILKQSSENITAGTLIDYKISLKGLPMIWKTKIENWNPPENFVDNQLKGPYKRWHHTHSFKEFPTGTLMKDYVIYELPMGRMGQLVAGNYVRKDILSIFAYRKKIIDQLWS